MQHAYKFTRMRSTSACKNLSIEHLILVNMVRSREKLYCSKFGIQQLLSQTISLGELRFCK